MLGIWSIFERGLQISLIYTLINLCDLIIDKWFINIDLYTPLHTPYGPLHLFVCCAFNWLSAVDIGN